MITETDVENYLIKKATKIGALVRKAQWVGHNHCPDRLIMAPHKTVWVEVKAPGKEPRDGQKREHARMRLAGQNVVVIDSKKGVDQFIQDFQEVKSA